MNAFAIHDAATNYGHAWRTPAGISSWKNQCGTLRMRFGRSIGPMSPGITSPLKSVYENSHKMPDYTTAAAGEQHWFSLGGGIYHVMVDVFGGGAYGFSATDALTEKLNPYIGFTSVPRYAALKGATYLGHSRDYAGATSPELALASDLDWAGWQQLLNSTGPALWASMQAYLKAHFGYAGLVNGIWGSLTIAALRRATDAGYPAAALSSPAPEPEAPPQADPEIEAPAATEPNAEPGPETSPPADDLPEAEGTAQAEPPTDTTTSENETAPPPARTPLRWWHGVIVLAVLAASTIWAALNSSF
jgi:hypothetical protein